MIDIEGKTVLTELEELVEPSHTALIVIDMQRDFIEPDGLFGSLGIDLSMYAESRPRLAALLGAARKAGTAVMHLQNTALPDRKSDSPAQIRFNLRMHKDARRNQPPLRYTIPGTPGHEFAPEFTPREDELVVRKYRSSGFWGTNLAMLLRSNGIKTVDRRRLHDGRLRRIHRPRRDVQRFLRRHRGRTAWPATTRPSTMPRCC